MAAIAKVGLRSYGMAPWEELFSSYNGLPL